KSVKGSQRGTPRSHRHPKRSYAGIWFLGYGSLMTEAVHAQLEDRRAWWEGRRLRFSLVVIAGYFATVILYELLTPWWVGDHVGIEPAALIFVYMPDGLIWVMVA